MITTFFFFWVEKNDYHQETFGKEYQLTLKSISKHQADMIEP